MKGIFGALFGSPAGDELKMTSRELEQLLRGGVSARSGAVVSWQTALQVTTMLACTRVIAEGIAQAPWKVYQGAAERVEAQDHPLSDLLYRAPNPWQTSFEFRETVAIHVVLTGDAFVHKLSVGSQRRLASLEPLDPGCMTVQREADGTLRYFYQPPQGTRVEIPAAEIWHIRGPSWNSWKGLDVTRLAREAIGLAIATESAHADLHAGGVRTAGVYATKEKLSAERFTFLAAWLDRHNQTGDRAGKPLVLDDDAKFLATQMSGVDAQHLETRKFQIEEICRAMRVIPLMVGQSDKTATYASVEQLLIAHVVHTLMPWYERFEQSADVNLLSDQDRANGFYTKFNANALMRGSAADRGKYLALALGAGGQKPFMTQDEARGFEELPPMGGLAAELGQGSMDKPPPQDPGTGA